MNRILRNAFSIYRKFLKNVLLITFHILNALPRGRFATSDALDSIFGKKTSVSIDSKSLEFHSPNWITNYRAKSILLKEPETIQWIKSMNLGSVLWDIGANIGTFTLYAASRKIKVVAIEPSFMNIELLNRNVISNQLADLVTILPFGVGSRTAVLDFFMSPEYLTWGGAHNSLGTNVGSGGESIKNPIRTHSLSFSIDLLIDIFKLPYPSHIKIDVDGLELEILKGALKTLKTVDSVLIEVDTKFVGNMDGIKSILEDSGLKIENSGQDNDGSHNQIWHRLSR